MRCLRLLVLIVAALVPTSLACQSIPPAAIPWRNVYTQLGSKARGIPLNAGKNHELGLRLSTMFSVTRVISSAVCEGSATLFEERDCDKLAGSLFDTTQPEFNQSFTVPYNFSMDPNDAFINTRLKNVPGGDIQEEGHISMIVSTSAGSSLDLGDYPLEVMTDLPDNLQRKSGLGVGKQSTFLDRLYQMGKIPSKVFGLYLGSSSETAPSDGELIVGGYYPGIVTSEFRNFTISDPSVTELSELHCAIQIPISNFTIEVQNKTYSLLPDRGYTLWACIDPFQQSMTLPNTMISRLLEVTGATIPPGQGLLSPKPVIPTTSDKVIQSVTITIENGSNNFQVTIPSTELMTSIAPMNTTNATSNVDLYQLEFRNTSDNYPVDKMQLPAAIFGATFLSQQYLLVDYSRNTFGLADAKYRGPTSGGTGLVTICDMDPNAQTVTRGSDKSVTIALAVVLSIGWLLVIFLSYIVCCLWKRTGRKREGSFGNSFTNSVPGGLGRRLSSFSAPPQPPLPKGHMETQAGHT
ncbi:hypothetical protein H072_4978 [Dactylellina haptotyla CBS 200.50]|uniref:Peptidase A1 domain-containing protein n=1 Tax=Dactylellina haptotyla (strain CBS 200.50) TaxID=1284197 RepID=S8ADS1_DACHA|nr:hypothetical protein H072_4978 [Dactylellina haptotyla CBS 200.50]